MQSFNRSEFERTTNASAVSAFLRRSGYLPVPRDREGMHVFVARDGATVTADWDTPARSMREADEVAGVLREGGYSVAHAHGQTTMRVTRN